MAGFKHFPLSIDELIRCNLKIKRVTANKNRCVSFLLTLKEKLKEQNNKELVDSIEMFLENIKNNKE